MLKWIFACISLLVIKSGDTVDFNVEVSSTGDYSIYVDSQLWLKSAPTFLTLGNKRCSVVDNCLKLLNKTKDGGFNKHGRWYGDSLHLVSGSTNFIATIQKYEGKSMLIFEQYFPDGAVGTATINPNFILSAFPNFQIGSQDPKVDLGYLNYGGMMVGDTTKWMDRWTDKTINLRDGVFGGPLALFAKNGSTVIISPFNEFMVGSSQHDQLIGGNMGWGILGSITSIPKGFVYRTVMHFGKDGINSAFEDWGETLRLEHDKSLDMAAVDFAVNYLGYWTDNGSYYYYNIPNDTSYDKILLEVQGYAQQQKIPYRYVQYDSWWYPQDPFKAVTEWEAMPGIFSEGMVNLYNKTKWPVVAHNKYWSAFTSYAKKNGGVFDFIVEELKSAPMDEGFWDWLFKRSKEWGLITYEQDWMTAQFLGLNAFKEDITAARTWLNLMGKAAAKNGLTLQYCMATPRCALQSLEIPAVTQARVSDDYEPGQNNWKIGISSIFAHAVGLRPYKDTFWTTQKQKGDVYERVEPWPALHALASVLSTGPVGPGDGLGMTNVSLLLRCCNADGLILKPSVPIRAIDDQIMEAAFHEGWGPDGEVYTTYTIIDDYHFGIIMAADMKNTYSITDYAAKLPSLVYMVYPDNPTTPQKGQQFGNSGPLLLKGCTNDNYCLYHVSPQISLGNGKWLVLRGEISKWVPMSPQRVHGIDLDDAGFVTIHLKGGVGESVDFWYDINDKPIKKTIVMSRDGIGSLRISV